MPNKDGDISEEIESASSFARSNKSSKYEVDPYEKDDDDVKSRFDSDTSSSKSSDGSESDDDGVKRQASLGSEQSNRKLKKKLNDMRRKSKVAQLNTDPRSNTVAAVG